MVGHLIERTVAFCMTYARLVAATVAALTLVAVAYAATHFALNTDTTKLVSPDLPWRKREAAFEAVFPQPKNLVLVVIDAQTSEQAHEASQALATALRGDPSLFSSVRILGGGPFFDRNGLLLVPLEETQSATSQMIAAQPFLGALAADPSLRGVMDSFSTALTGVERGQISLDRLARPLGEVRKSLDAFLAGHPAYLSWRKLMMEGTPGQRETRQILQVLVALDFTALSPGAKASDAIRAHAGALGLTPRDGITVRLTGPARIFDEEFATLTERALPIATAVIAAILIMLWFALRSVRLIVCVLITILSGLAITTALGLALLGAFNIISVAFIALFVGLGIDFGIQVCVRYEAERESKGVAEALLSTGRGLGPSLTLAALAISAGFLAFLPTSYRGVAALGLIAGIGMLLTFVLSLTLLPALITLMPPSPSKAEIGVKAAAPLNAFLLRHARSLMIVATVAGVAAGALLPFLRFDFNLLNLRSRKVESISTLLDLSRDPDFSPNTMDVVAPSRQAAAALAAKIASLPEVAKVVTINDFLPADQNEKLALIADASMILDPTLNPAQTKPPPTDAEMVDSLRQTSRQLLAAVQSSPTSSAAADAKALSADLDRLANGDAPERARAAKMLTAGLSTILGRVRNLLSASPITMASLPPEIARDFIAPSGAARVHIYPKGDPTDNATLSRFRRAVASIAPQAVGVPVFLEESGRTIVGAFVDAGVWSLLAIALLLAVMLGSVRYALLSLAPLMLAGLLTLATCVVIGLKLNYANIIALPLLFGIGVAYDIYFVMAWRTGARDLLQSPLARAIGFSAGTTATGFGALWFSSHPGTSSMGELLMISLVWILAVVLLVVPPLLQVTTPEAKS
ncbi:MAG: MMPL family transporter [Alphaproteobacteria bacterium]|nr:MMPL family transporter [Alphaproteobacteria bacterium]